MQIVTVAVTTATDAAVTMTATTGGTVVAATVAVVVTGTRATVATTGAGTDQSLSDKLTRTRPREQPGSFFAPTIHSNLAGRGQRARRVIAYLCW